MPPTSSLLSQGTGVPATEWHRDLLALVPLSAWASVQGGETALAVVSLPGHITSLEGGLARSKPRVRHYLPHHAACGGSARKGWEILLGDNLGRLEKSHLLSPPQGHNAGVPMPERALRAALWMLFPHQRDTAPKPAATFATLLSKVFGGEHPCQGSRKKDL